MMRCKSDSVVKLVSQPRVSTRYARSRDRWLACWSGVSASWSAAMIAWLGTPTLATVPRGVAGGFPSALSARNGLIEELRGAWDLS